MDPGVDLASRRNINQTAPPAGLEPAAAGIEVQPKAFAGANLARWGLITSKEFDSARWSWGPISGPSFGPVKTSALAQKPDLDLEPGNFRQLLISGDDQIDIRVRHRRCKDQSVGHAKGLEAAPEVGCHIGDGDVNGQDGGKQPTEESCNVVLVVMPE